MRPNQAVGRILCRQALGSPHACPLCVYRRRGPKAFPMDECNIRREIMLRSIKAVLIVAGCAIAIPVAAQAPTTAFDGCTQPTLMIRLHTDPVIVL